MLLLLTPLHNITITFTNNKKITNILLTKTIDSI